MADAPRHCGLCRRPLPAHRHELCALRGQMALSASPARRRSRLQSIVGRGHAGERGRDERRTGAR